MTLDLPTLTLLGTVVVSPLVAGAGYAIKRRWDEKTTERNAETKRYLDKIDALQERIFNMQQEQIKAEVLRAATTGDTNQILKTLASAVSELTKAKANT